MRIHVPDKNLTLFEVVGYYVNYIILFTYSCIYNIEKQRSVSVFVQKDNSILLRKYIELNWVLQLINFGNWVNLLQNTLLQCHQSADLSHVLPSKILFWKKGQPVTCNYLKSINMNLTCSYCFFWWFIIFFINFIIIILSDWLFNSIFISDCLSYLYNIWSLSCNIRKHNLLIGPNKLQSTHQFSFFLLFSVLLSPLLVRQPDCLLSHPLLLLLLLLAVNLLSIPNWLITNFNVYMQVVQDMYQNKHIR